MPSVVELAALTYTGPSPFAQGLLVEDYRHEYAQPGQGERVRYFPARQADPGTSGRDRTGRLYTEQLYCADGTTLISAVRVMVWETTQDIEDAEFGLLPAGTTMLSVIPDEIPAARLDRFVLPDRRIVVRRVLTRGDDFDDSIFNDASASIPTPVDSIVRVWRNNIVYRPEIDYTLTNNNIEWLGVTHDITRANSGDFDALPSVPSPGPAQPTFIFTITQVINNVTVTYNHAVDYGLTNSNAIQWLTGNRPAPGSEYQATVRYWPEHVDPENSLDMDGDSYGIEVAYNPVFTALGQGERTARPDVTNALLPLRFALKMEQPGQY